MDRMQFEITSKDNKKVTCEVIATYHDDESNKDFIVYTDGTLDSNNKLNLFYSLYKIKSNKIELIDITSNHDRKIGLELIKELLIKK